MKASHPQVTRRRAKEKVAKVQEEKRPASSGPQLEPNSDMGKVKLLLFFLALGNII